MFESRRSFLKTSAVLFSAPYFSNILFASNDQLSSKEHELPNELFDISLAEWSIHVAVKKGELSNLDFARFTREDCGIGAIEYVSRFFNGKAEDEKYLSQLNRLAADHNVKQLLIMVDDEGKLGDPNEKKRAEAIRKHYKWIHAAKDLGCHSIRVNAASKGSYEEQVKLAVDGLARLGEYGASHEMNVIVENHGGLSSNGQWLSEVLKTVDLKNVGSLPDFGNFNLGNGKTYDRYKGVTELMPFAKAVSAKSNNFDQEGNETGTDFKRMMKIVLDSGYNGYVGIEYEGNKLSELEGILATKKLLLKVREELSAS